MPSNATFTCPVCGFPGLSEPAYDEHGCASFDICPSCGTEFGYDNATRSAEELRKRWIETGAPWGSKTTPPPPGWDGTKQLANAGLSPVPDSANSR